MKKTFKITIEEVSEEEKPLTIEEALKNIKDKIFENYPYCLGEDKLIRWFRI